jgi:hypothetical protein
LDHAWIIRAGDSAEVAGAQIGADPVVDAVTLPLGVVPDVVEFRAELQVDAPRFVEHEILEDGHVPVLTARAVHAVVGFVAPSPRCRSGEGRGIEPFLHGMRVRERPGLTSRDVTRRWLKKLR